MCPPILARRVAPALLFFAEVRDYPQSKQKRAFLLSWIAIWCLFPIWGVTSHGCPIWTSFQFQPIRRKKEIDMMPIISQVKQCALNAGTSMSVGEPFESIVQLMRGDHNLLSYWYFRKKSSNPTLPSFCRGRSRNGTNQNQWSEELYHVCYWFSWQQCQLPLRSAEATDSHIWTQQIETKAS